MRYTLTLLQLRKLNPCRETLERVSALMSNRGAIDAAEARQLGCTYDDIIWAASALAMGDEALVRRLTHFVNDNAKTVLHLWEERWPKDDRPRKSIEACDGFLAGTTSDEDWRRDAWDARDAWAARAAWAAWAARDAWAAWAARDAWAARAAWAAWAARAARAAWDARDAWAARFNEWQFDRLIYWLVEADPVPLPMPEKGASILSFEDK